MSKKLLLLILVALAATFAIGNVVADEDGWTPPAPFTLAEGASQTIVADAANDGQVQVINNGPGEIEVVVKNPNGSPLKVKVAADNSVIVSVDKHGDVTIKDVNDAANDGSAGTWSADI